ncbi:type VI secretion system protein ImpL, partial [Pseudomonas agarici]
MQFRRVVWLLALVVALLLIGTILSVLVWHYPAMFGFRSGSDRQTMGLWVIAATTLVLVLCVAAYHLLGQQLGHSAYLQLKADDVPPPTQIGLPESLDTQTAQIISSIKVHLRDHYGLFWRRKVRLLLVIGESAEIEAIAPTLTKQ